MDCEEFVDFVFGKGAEVNFWVSVKGGGGSPRVHNFQTYDAAKDWLKTANNEGRDIYYGVNRGGTKDAQIKEITECFVDLDVGKDENHRYFSSETVAEKKPLLLERLHQFCLEPSVIVETRNGYQAHWKVTDCSIEQFKDIQNWLIIRFEADPQVKSLSQRLRLPGFNWVKNGSGHPPFPCIVIESSMNSYSSDDLLRVLPSTGSVIRSPEPPTPQLDSDTPNNTGITTKSIIGCSGILTDAVVQSLGEAIVYLKQQDLAEYLGEVHAVGRKSLTMCCPFHKDNDPSATVYRTSATGYWYLKCHSSSCGFMGSIIDVAKRQLNTKSNSKAILYLAKKYKLEIQDEWRSEQKAILLDNLDIILDTEALKELYPNLHRVTRQMAYDLSYKLDHALEHLSVEEYSHDGCVVFFGSLRYFEMVRKRATEMSKGHRSHNKRIDRYCLLGLMHKLSDEQVPEKLLKEAKRIKKMRRMGRRMQFYSFSSYTPELLAEAERRAEILSSSRLSMRGIGPQSVVKLFGEELAKEIYPQEKDLSLSDEARKFKAELSNAVSAAVKDKGYATKTDMLEVLVKQYGYKRSTSDRIEMHLPDVLTELKLVRTKCSKVLKQKYGIMSKGYPVIIIAAQEEQMQTKKNGEDLAA